MTNGPEKSDLPIVAAKLANKPRKLGAESVERRGGAKGNTDWSRTRRTQSRESVSQRLDRVRQAARQRKKERFTALFHLIDIDLLGTSFFWLKRKAAAGVDGVRWRDYDLPHICGRARDGKFMLRRKTRRDRLRATLRPIKDELRHRWHHSIPEQGKWLRQVVQGYLNYPPCRPTARP